MTDKPGWRDGSGKLAASAPRPATGLPADEDEPAEELDSSRAYACVRGQRVSADVFELRMLNPAEPNQALEYSLRRRTLWNKAEGSITVEFVDGLRATIRGVGLFDLKQKLLRRMVTWVQEQGKDPVEMKAAERAAKATGDTFVWVEEIVIEEREEEEEKG